MAQIQWKFTSKKITDSLFEIHLSASIQDGWHVYSQIQPQESIVDPIEIKFDETPEIQFLGGVKEIGNKEFRESKVAGIKSCEFKSFVDFVQTIKTSKSSPISLKGNITFMLCSEEQCLPPETKVFKIQIQ